VPSARRIGPHGREPDRRKHKHERFTTDLSLFEVVFGGASGAMQPFSKRMMQGGDPESDGLRVHLMKS
jgi:hypothetical protein